MPLKSRNIFGTKDLTREEIELVFKTASELKKMTKKEIKEKSLLIGKTVMNLFFENSTRTRSSFELAAKRLGADVINMSIATSSLKKGETLMDTAKTLDAMDNDIYVIRHSASGAPQMFSKYVKGNVINAGDGANEHPTQALLDTFTIYEKKGTLDGLKIAIIGDILHSRVARSNLYLLKKFDVDLTFVGPETLVPKDFEKLGVKVTDKIDDIIEDMDVLNILRIQLERQDQSFFPTLKEYSKTYGINNERLKKLKEDVIIMHPGPMNRGVEISYDVADCDKQVILDQVENGLMIRMALLHLVIEGQLNK